MYVLKIIMRTPFEKFIEAFRLITKVFLGEDSNRVENTPSKNILERCLAISNLPHGVYFEK